MLLVPIGFRQLTVIGETVPEDIALVGSVITSNALTFSYTCEAGNNRILVVVVSQANDNAAAPGITGITFNSQNLTQLASFGDSPSGDGYRLSIYYLPNPPQVTANIIITETGGQARYSHVQTYSGVNQVTPFGSVVNSTNRLSPSVDVSSESTDLVIDTCMSIAASSTPTITATAGQTLLATSGFNGGGVLYARVTCGYKSPSTPTTTMSYSVSDLTWQATRLIGVALKRA